MAVGGGPAGRGADDISSGVLGTGASDLSEIVRIEVHPSANGVLGPWAAN